jgi:glutamate synthase domain-containing protein 1
MMNDFIDTYPWPPVTTPDTGRPSRADCGSDGVGPGFCGLYAAIGDVHLIASLEAAKTMQERGTYGAGVLLRGIYPKRANYFAFHVMYRNREVAKELEHLFEEGKLGLRHFGEMEPLVTAEAYRKFDLPEMRRYFMSAPTQDEMMRKMHTTDERVFVRKVVESFNNRYMGDARIFSSGKNMGVFVTAMTLADTIETFDLEQYADKPINALLTHMRWPTSIVGTGVWWGVHPISILNSAIVHNGDLSSAPSNQQGLEAAEVKRCVGTDSEAILLEIDDLIDKRGLSYQQTEWLLCQKFPKELDVLSPEERASYEQLVSDPIMMRYKMSGPSSFIALIDNKIIAGRDRDGLRQLWMGRSDDGKTIIWGSEEKVIYQSAWIAGKNFKSVNCEPGRLVAYEFKEDGSIEGVFGETL